MKLSPKNIESNPGLAVAPVAKDRSRQTDDKLRNTLRGTILAAVMSAMSAGMGCGSETTGTGGAGGDTMTGGAGGDTMTGGAGGETMTGGAGGETMTGGAGGYQPMGNIKFWDACTVADTVIGVPHGSGLEVAELVDIRGKLWLGGVTYKEIQGNFSVAGNSYRCRPSKETEIILFSDDGTDQPQVDPQNVSSLTLDTSIWPNIDGQAQMPPNTRGFTVQVDPNPQLVPAGGHVWAGITHKEEADPLHPGETISGCTAACLVDAAINPLYETAYRAGTAGAPYNWVVDGSKQPMITASEKTPPNPVPPVTTNGIQGFQCLPDEIEIGVYHLPIGLVRVTTKAQETDSTTLALN